MKRRWLWIAGTLLAVVLVLLLAMRQLGNWLTLDEPLRKSDAIAVLGGGQPFRAIEAARLYVDGWAPEVWLTQGITENEYAELAKIGINMGDETAVSREVLLKQKVPESAIRLVPEHVQNTVSELRIIAAFARVRKARSVIIVTSKSHTRRVRILWSIVAPGQTAIVRFIPSDTFDSRRWWSNTQDALNAFRELFSILNAWAGFPITPRER